MTFNRKCEMKDSEGCIVGSLVVHKLLEATFKAEQSGA